MKDGSWGGMGVEDLGLPVRSAGERGTPAEKGLGYLDGTRQLQGKRQMPEEKRKKRS